MDERRAKPSASGLYRLEGCIGSFKKERRAPRIESKDSKAGDDVHDLLADETTADEVEHSAEQTAEMCQAQISELVEAWLGGETCTLELKEVRYGLTALGRVVEVTPDSKAEFIFTGKFDRLYIAGDRGFLGDFKALYGKYPQALDNPQLMGLAVLVAEKHRLSSVRAALIQPWKGRPSQADLSEASLYAARKWLENLLVREVMATEHNLTAGEWCHNCSARFFCEKFTDTTLQEFEVVQPMKIAGMDGKAQRAAMYAMITELPPASHFAHWQGLKMVKRYVDAMEAATKDRAECDPEFQKYVTLEEGRQGNRVIEDAQQAFEKLAPLGVTAEDMLAAAKVSPAKLQEAVRKRSGVKSQTAKATKYNLTDSAARAAMEKALIGVMSNKPPVMELVPVERCIEV